MAAAGAYEACADMHTLCIHPVLLFDAPSSASSYVLRRAFAVTPVAPDATVCRSPPPCAAQRPVSPGVDVVGVSPSPGHSVAAVSPVPAQTWQACRDSRANARPGLSQTFLRAARCCIFFMYTMSLCCADGIAECTASKPSLRISLKRYATFQWRQVMQHVAAGRVCG